MKEESKWISVKDRLPNEDEVYNDLLCYFEGWDDTFFMRTLEYDINVEEWSDHEGNEYKKVTHWKQIEPPKN